MFVRREKPQAGLKVQNSQVGNCALPYSKEEASRHAFLADKGGAMSFEAIARTGFFFEP